MNAAVRSGLLGGATVYGGAGGRRGQATVAALAALGAAVAPGPDDRVGLQCPLADGEPVTVWVGAREDDPAVPPWTDAGFAGVGGVGGAAVRTRVEGLMRALELVSAALGHRVVLSPALLGERAAIAGLGPPGRVSAGGSCRMVRAADGWLAVNLARPDDVAAIPAWLDLPEHLCTGTGFVRDDRGVGGTGFVRDDRGVGGTGFVRDELRGAVSSTSGDRPEQVAGPPVWAAVEAACCARSVAALLERAMLLGLPVSAVPPPGAPPFSAGLVRATAPGPVGTRGPAGRATADRPLRVVDLSSLWAGPLCARILTLAGADVTKVESVERPDGARSGPPAFFELLHRGQSGERVALRTVDGRARLRALLEAADVVIEASRPRALQQLGIDAEAVIAAHPKIWLSLTAYGRTGDGALRTGFGDDVAAGAGLVDWTTTGPQFVGDAIADPIGGITGALMVLAAHLRGGPVLLDVSMHDAAAFVAADAGGAGGAGGAAGPVAPFTP